MSTISIGPESPLTPEVLALLAQSHALMESLYPAESNHMLDPADLAGPQARFFVARLDGAAVGCGGFVRAGAGEAELKSMFVDPAARGLKLGRRLLQAIEAEAAADGVRLMRLETGVSQPEAIGLYRSAGYAEIGAFGAYRPDPLSLFMEKRLA